MIKGIIGKKVGMTQVFLPDGVVVPVTVIQAGPCWVTQVKTDGKDGYNAVQLGFEEVAGNEPDAEKRRRKIERRMTKATRGHLGLVEPSEKHPRRRQLLGAVPALRYLREFRVEGLDGVEEGQQITVNVFNTGERVDVIGTTKGRGFTGNIKRHGFRRQPKTHGASDRVRRPGSIGTNSTPGYVKKGQRMAGRSGGARMTSQNLEVIVVDEERNLIAVKGSIPGAKGGLVVVRPAK
ncbi:MAG: 50S ribosomal protein L3 [Anaerolineae bacterium]|nr:50S ribosomal protein L3 [Anaerolineae bacterium]